MGQDILGLEAEAKHARERYRLYRAKTYGPSPTDPAHLRDLERVATAAEQRLQRSARARVRGGLSGVPRGVS